MSEDFDPMPVDELNFGLRPEAKGTFPSDDEDDMFEVFRDGVYIHSPNTNDETRRKFIIGQ